MKERQRWKSEEDALLLNYVNLYGPREWGLLSQRMNAPFFKRDAKSCLERWKNYLRPGIKKGSLTEEEQRLVIRLQAKHGNKWKKIAAEVPGRTAKRLGKWWEVFKERKQREEERDQRGTGVAAGGAVVTGPADQGKYDDQLLENFAEKLAKGQNRQSCAAVFHDEAPIAVAFSHAHFILANDHRLSFAGRSRLFLLPVAPISTSSRHGNQLRHSSVHTTATRQRTATRRAPRLLQGPRGRPPRMGGAQEGGQLDAQEGTAAARIRKGNEEEEGEDGRDPRQDLGHQGRREGGAREDRRRVQGTDLRPQEGSGCKRAETRRAVVCETSGAGQVPRPDANAYGNGRRGMLNHRLKV